MHAWRIHVHHFDHYLWGPGLCYHTPPPPRSTTHRDVSTRLCVTHAPPTTDVSATGWLAHIVPISSSSSSRMEKKCNADAVQEQASNASLKSSVLLPLTATSCSLIGDTRMASLTKLAWRHYATLLWSILYGFGSNRNKQQTSFYQARKVADNLRVVFGGSTLPQSHRQILWASLNSVKQYHYYSVASYKRCYPIGCSTCTSFTSRQSAVCCAHTFGKTS